VVGVTALPSGLLTGAIWHAAGAQAALAFSAALAGVACVLILVWERTWGRAGGAD
jgi:hypothetical protein